MSYSHDPLIVILAVTLSVIASYTALTLAARIADGTVQQGRCLWLWLAATALGGGIFAMHFIAMLACDMGMPVQYDASLTLLSAALAILFTALGLWLAFRDKAGRINFTVGGLVMGSGVAAMHYTGMAAIRMPATIQYDAGYVILAVAIAIVAATVAIMLCKSRPTVAGRCAAAAVMGIAVSGMHFTGMVGLQMTPAPYADVTGVDQDFLAYAVAFVTIVILGIGQGAAVVGRRFDRLQAMEAERVRISEQRFRLLVDGVTDHAICMLSPTGEVTSWNAGAERINGYTADEIVGRNFSLFYTPDDLSANVPERTLQIARAEGKAECETRHVRKDGEIFWANVSVTSVYDDAGNLAGYAKVTRDITEKRERDLKLQAAYENLEELVEERTLELQEAKDAAEAASRAKSDFLANMSHELRTPLNAIIGYSEMLHEDAVDLGLSEAVEDLGKIHDAGRHLLSLINAILDLSKIESGKMEVFPETFDIRDVIGEVVATIGIEAEKQGNELKVLIDEGVPLFETDVVKVRQCVLNLTSNANKFTRNGTVAIGVTPGPEEGFIEISVTDTGIGMSEVQLAGLFAPFTQADVSTTRQYGGTGLGLSITRRMCRLLGGDVEADSQPGCGSTFTLRIPTAYSQPGAPCAPETPERTAAKVEHFPAPSDSNLQPILIVEDDQRMGEMLERFVERDRWSVMRATNGLEAIDLLLHAERPPAAIILDLMMPMMDGFELLEHLKSSSTLRDIPIIVLTAKDLDTFDLLRLDGHVDRLLIKGAMDREQIVAEIDRVVQQPAEKRRITAATNR